MKPNPTRSALLVIDMENGFTDPRGSLCIPGAADTVDACARAAEIARSRGIPVFFVKRIYRRDGSDVELARAETWTAGGRACAPASRGPNSAQAPAALRPRPGDYTIIKPRWSAFFGTELDLILRRLDVRTVILTGTTTPNCVRTTCYDALALDYQVMLLTDCCSARTAEIQRVNLEDMERAGAMLSNVSAFESFDAMPDRAAALRRRMEAEGQDPEPFQPLPDAVAWTDLW
jgi:nicotinamidase-related amidase